MKRNSREHSREIDLLLDRMRSVDPRASESDPPAPLCLDFDREARCGFPEVVFGEGKSTSE
ncbi:MAG: hypothetical protein KDC38_14915, partial [Planctomycetes bacterium]|nr:hypothetical protein [Planctomycetota bacterium]